MTAGVYPVFYCREGGELDLIDIAIDQIPGPGVYWIGGVSLSIARLDTRSIIELPYSFKETGQKQ